MFDFFRDIALEMSGIDSKAAKEEREEKREEKRKQRFIFSRSAKVITFVFGILYLIVAGLNIAMMKQSGTMEFVSIIRFSLLTICDIAAMVCLAIGKKKTEIAALILIFVFLIGQYFTVVLL